jgi:hypothetical protein
MTFCHPLGAFDPLRTTHQNGSRIALRNDRLSRSFRIRSLRVSLEDTIAPNTDRAPRGRTQGLVPRRESHPQGIMLAHPQIVTIATLTAVAPIVACSWFANKPKAGRIDPEGASPSALWNATLSATGNVAGAVAVHGTATIVAQGSDTSVATIAIASGTPGRVYPWHVYQGQCENPGPAVGSATAYAPLTVDRTGAAHAAATLALKLPISGFYCVALSASVAHLQTVVACGNLMPPNDG